MSNKTELLLKIKALAERGEGGEKESAQLFLSRLMDKYGITESDLNEEIVECEWFRYKNDLQYRLLRQVIWMVTGDSVTYKKTGGNYKLVGAYCTAYQKIEIEANYDFFKKAMDTELKIFYRAFVNKNNIFPAKEIRKQETPKEKCTLDEMIKVESMMNGMEKHTLKKMIGVKENEDNFSN